MMRLRRASVIAALSLLTSAATAYAECAWVLWAGTWVESRTISDPPARMEWMIIRAYSQEDGGSRACTLERDRWMDRQEEARQKWMKEDAPPPISCGPNWRMDVSKEPPTLRSYDCLPDTVDPRGPKGK